MFGLYSGMFLKGKSNSLCNQRDRQSKCEHVRARVHVSISTQGSVRASVVALVRVFTQGCMRTSVRVCAHVLARMHVRVWVSLHL